MSTTVVHPESVSGHGPSGRTIGMAVAGLAVAAALGFAITNQSAPETGVAGSAQVDAADRKYQEQGATRAAQQQLLLKQATRGVVPPSIVGTQVAPADSIANAELLAFGRQALRGVTTPESAQVNQQAQWDSHAEFLRRINTSQEYSLGVNTAGENGPGLMPGDSGIR